jgi:hypothetical protein
MQRHHLHAVFPLLRLAFAGLERGVREKSLERRKFADLGRKPACGAHQLIEVLHPRLASVGFLASVVLEQPACLEHSIDLLVQRERCGVPGEPLDEPHEAVHRRGGLGTEGATADTGCGGFPQRAAGAARRLAQHLQTLRTDAARRQIHHALEGGVIAPVGDEAQIGERVLDLGALEEAQTTVHAVRHARGEERLFEHARLRIGAVENGDLAPRPAL